MYELPIQEQHGTVKENRYLKAKGTCQLNEATDGFRVQGIIACFISIVSLLMLTNQTYSEKGNGLSFPSFDLYCVCVYMLHLIFQVLRLGDLIMCDRNA